MDVMVVSLYFFVLFYSSCCYLFSFLSTFFFFAVTYGMRRPPLEPLSVYTTRGLIYNGKVLRLMNVTMVMGGGGDGLGMGWMGWMDG